VRLQVDDVNVGGRVRDRATVETERDTLPLREADS
jgi:hypothetical protein